MTRSILRWLWVRKWSLTLLTFNTLPISCLLDNENEDLVFSMALTFLFFLMKGGSIFVPWETGLGGGGNQTLTYSVSGRKRHLSRKLYTEGKIFVLINSSEFPLSQCRSKERIGKGETWKINDICREKRNPTFGCNNIFKWGMEILLQTASPERIHAP